MRFLGYIILCFLLSGCFQSKMTPEKQSTKMRKTQSYLSGDKVSSEVTKMPLERKIAQLVIYKADSLSELATNKAGGYMLRNDDPMAHAQVVAQRDSVLKPLFYTQAGLSLNNHFSGFPTFPVPLAFGAQEDTENIPFVWDYFVSQVEKTGIDVVINQPFAPNPDVWDTNLLSYRYKDYLENARDWKQRSLSSDFLIGAATIHDLPPEIIENPSCPTDFYLKYQYLEQFQPTFCLLEPTVLTDSTNTGLYWTEKLFDFFNYEGLTISTVSKTEEVVSFLEGGVDLLLTDIPVDSVVKVVKLAIQNKQLEPWMIDFKVSRLLQAKEKKLKKKPTFKVDTVALENLFDWKMAEEYSEKIYQDAVCLAKTTKDFPLGPLQNIRMDVLMAGNMDFSDVVRPLSFYLSPRQLRVEALNLKSLPNGNHLLFLIPPGEDYRSLDSVVNYINLLDTNRYQLSIINFSAPSALRKLQTNYNLVQNIGLTPVSLSHSVQVLFGGATATGRLVQSVHRTLPQGTYKRIPQTTLGLTRPAFENLRPAQLQAIDNIMAEAIRQQAFPGAQVLVAKNNKVVYQKSFGHQTYSKKTAVSNQHLYDIASISKIFATTLATMKMEESGSLSLEEKVKQTIKTDYPSTLEDIRLKELLTHTSGIQPDMPIQHIAWKSKKPASGCNEYWCVSPNDSARKVIADKMYVKDEAIEDLWKTIFTRAPFNTKRYRYSDVNFNLLQKIIESKVGQPLDRYMNDYFYGPMGLQRMLFNPLQRFSASEIVPTEQDKDFRKQLVRGYVHDEAAAILGGVGGNAGLFANAEDCAKIGQMLLNGGKYGDIRFLKPATIQKYIRYSNNSNRGLGFDKPRKTKYPAFSDAAPDATFGHTGFTGTCIWIDPDNQLIYVFLSNRVHPKKFNRAFYKLNPRKTVHDAIYKSMSKDLLKLPSIYDKPSDKKEDVLASLEICKESDS